MFKRDSLSLLILFLSLTAGVLAEQRLPLVIGHRGASGYRPMHSRGAQELALEQGVDYLEFDIQSSMNGTLIVSHDPTLNHWTDIEDRPDFADRAIDGEWFLKDFTGPELETLFTRQDYETRSSEYDDIWHVQTLDTVMQWIDEVNADRMSLGLGKIGLYVETKDPDYWRDLGIPIEETLIETLGAHGYLEEGVPLYLQSFGDNIPLLKSLAPNVTALALRRDDDDTSDEALEAIQATGAGGVGVPLKIVLDDGDLSLYDPGFVTRAHAVGLLVHIYTVREGGSGLWHRNREAVRSGVEGIFSDYPDKTIVERLKMICWEDAGMMMTLECSVVWGVWGGATLAVVAIIIASGWFLVSHRRRRQQSDQEAGPDVDKVDGEGTATNVEVESL